MITQILINRNSIFHRHPLSTIANFMIFNLIRKTTPATMVAFVASFVTVISEFICNIGIFRTIRILLGIRQALNIKATGSVLRDILTGTLAVETIVRVLEPEWTKLVKNNISFNKILNVTIFITSTFFFIKPIFKFVYKTFFLSFCTLFTIAYTPLIETYKVIKDLCSFSLSFLPQSIIQFLPNKIKNLYIPNLELKIEPIKNIEEKDNYESLRETYKKDVVNRYTLSYTNIAILSATAIGGIIIGVDHYYPDIKYIHAWTKFIGISGYKYPYNAIKELYNNYISDNLQECYDNIRDFITGNRNRQYGPRIRPEDFETPPGTPPSYPETTGTSHTGEPINNRSSSPDSVSSDDTVRG